MRKILYFSCFHCKHVTAHSYVDSGIPMDLRCKCGSRLVFDGKWVRYGYSTGSAVWNALQCAK